MKVQSLSSQSRNLCFPQHTDETLRLNGDECPASAHLREWASEERASKHWGMLKRLRVENAAPGSHVQMCVINASLPILRVTLLVFDWMPPCWFESHKQEERRKKIEDSSVFAREQDDTEWNEAESFEVCASLMFRFDAWKETFFLLKRDKVFQLRQTFMNLCK